MASGVVYVDVGEAFVELVKTADVAAGLRGLITTAGSPAKYRVYQGAMPVTQNAQALLPAVVVTGNGGSTGNGGVQELTLQVRLIGLKQVEVIALNCALLALHDEDEGGVTTEHYAFR